MSKINPNDYSDYEDKAKGRPKLHKKKKGTTAADRAQRKEEIKAAQEARAKEARIRIKKHLSEGKNKAEIYTRWVEESLRLNYPQLTEGDIEIKASLPKVKAGGQHLQKRSTAVRMTHKPTAISVRNEEERSREQNEQAAKAILFTRLQEHLKLWETLIENSPSPVDVGKKVVSLQRK